MTNGYETLRAILDEAYAQSATGKGRERHATDGEPWERQPILEISRRVGLGFPLGQAIKKCTEAAGMVERGQADAAVRELLGAIVYTAAGVALVRGTNSETQVKPAVETRQKPDGVTVKPHGVYERRDGVIIGIHRFTPDGVIATQDNGDVVYADTGRANYLSDDGALHDLVREIAVGNGWKPWNGGERPVNGDNTVEYTLRGGYRRYSTASSISWNHIGCVDDIIAYRVVTNNAMPAPTAAAAE